MSRLDPGLNPTWEEAIPAIDVIPIYLYGSYSPWMCNMCKLKDYVFYRDKACEIYLVWNKQTKRILINFTCKKFVSSLEQNSWLDLGLDSGYTKSKHPLVL